MLSGKLRVIEVIKIVKTKPGSLLHNMSKFSLENNYAENICDH